MTSIFGSTGKDQTAAAANADPLQKTPVLATLVNTYMYDDSLVVRNLDYILALVRQTNLFASTSADPAVVAAHEAAVSKWAIGVAKLAQSRTSASVRYAGVVLVHATIEKCGSVAGVAVNWERILQSALRPLNSPSTPSDVGVQLEAIKALVALYVRCLEVPDMKRELIDASMPRLLEALVQMATPTDATGPNVLYSPVLIQPALLALQTLVRIFPSLARQKRMSEKISALCESLLGSSDAAVRSCAIRCLVTTCEVGNKPNATAAWRVIIMRAIATMHAAIDRLASTVREDIRSPIYIRDTKSLPYPGLSEFSEDDLEAIPLAARRVQALAASVADILDTSMRFAVSVPIHHIVSIVSRLASLNSSVTITETATQMAHRLFVTTIPNIHQNGALLLIQALTAACRSHALPYLGQMMRDVHIILDTASSNVADGVRVAAYGTMTTMLHTFGLGAAHGLRETFYASLLSDLEGARRPLAIGAFGGISAEQPGSKRRKTNGGGNNAASNAAALLVASPSNESEGVRGSNVTSDGMTWSASHLAVLSLVHTLIQDSSSAIPPNVRVSVDRLIIQQVLRGSHTKRHGNECADERIMAIKCLVAAIGSPSTALSLQAGGGSGGGSNGGGMMLPHARRALTAGLTDGSAKLDHVEITLLILSVQFKESSLPLYQWLTTSQHKPSRLHPFILLQLPSQYR
ncbi:hypothetical protein GQ42DRAFT_155669 [Ramicandelaber brevisporus]|nr:hypothetical protein GQ42DRAFT_155669 [Ramicandelaber brevisporus]